MIFENNHLNAFLSIYMPWDDYLLGIKEFEFKNNKLFSQEDNKYYNYKSIDFGYRINVKSKRKETNLKIPCYAVSNKHFYYSNKSIKTNLGIKVKPAINNINNPKLDNVFLSSVDNKFNIIVLFDINDVLFCDGNEVSVKKIYILNTSTFFNKIVPILTKFNLIENKEEFKSIYNDILFIISGGKRD